MIIVGLDISSFQINACYLEDDDPPQFKVGILCVERKQTLVERIGNVRPVIRDLCDWHDPYGKLMGRPDWLVVEEPFGGRNMPKALLLVAGAILSSTPSYVAPWLITPMDWRAAIGARNNKPDGHRAVREWLPNRAHDWYTGDELDALGIALGARKILEGQA